MNILYIAEDISIPGFHGGSTHVQETINALKELGHKVFVICKKGEGQKENETKDGVTYSRIQLPKNSLAKNAKLFLELGGIAKKIIQKEKIELVWQRNRIFGNQGIIEGKKLGTKTILEMNEPIQTSETNLMFPLIKQWFFYSVNFADKVTGTHKIMFNGIPQEKQLLTWHGSNIKLFNPKRVDNKLAKKYNLKGKTLFYSGSFQEWHCLKNALLAFKEVQKNYSQAAFLLAGEGKQKKELNDFVQEQKIKNVHFLGNIPFDMLAYYINSCEACVVLYDRNYETIKKYDYFYSPIKIFDAMSCGKIVIASRIGNIKGLIEENLNGYLVNEQNVLELAKAIKSAFSLSDKKKKLIEKRNIQQIKETYNWKAITKRILENL